MTKEQRKLIELNEGERGKVISIEGGKMSTKRLADLGLNPGTEIRLIRKALFSGPVQIEINGSKLVLGQGLASRIIVG